MNRHTVFATIAALFSAVAVITGCTKECEVQCIENGQTFISRLPKMKEYECKELNTVERDSNCTYRWAE